MNTYSLYGTKLIENDETLEDFARSIIKNVPTDDLKELENKYCVEIDETEFEDEFMKRVDEILQYDIARTDINYYKLMERYAPEIGPLLYDIENHGGDLKGFPITFFGKNVGDCFNKLVAEKVWFLAFYEEGWKGEKSV